MTTYNPREVPSADTARTRFAVSTSPSGITQETASNVATCFEQLATELLAAAEPLEPELRTFKLEKVARTESGHALVSRGTVAGIPNSKNERPTKLGQIKNLRAGALLDSLFLGRGNPGHDAATDREVWDALLELAEQERPSGEALRRLNDITARVLLARAGLTPPHPGDLPN